MNILEYTQEPGKLYTVALEYVKEGVFDMVRESPFDHRQDNSHLFDGIELTPRERGLLLSYASDVAEAIERNNKLNISEANKIHSNTSVPLSLFSGLMAFAVSNRFNQNIYGNVAIGFAAGFIAQEVLAFYLMIRAKNKTEGLDSELNVLNARTLEKLLEINKAKE